MAEFEVTGEKPAGTHYFKVGRALVHKDELRVIVDGRGWYGVTVADLRILLLLGGAVPVHNAGGNAVGEAILSPSGRSLVFEEVGVLIIVRDLRRMLATPSGRAAVWVVEE